MNLNKIFLRQLDLVSPKQLDFSVLIIGAGGIGSWVALVLSKMGCNDITVVDYDVVEAKNTPSQLYTIDQIGKPKAEALKETVEKLTGVEIRAVNQKWQDFYNISVEKYGVIICTVDSMEQRQNIWFAIMHDWYTKKHFECYIDARMGGELMRILLVNPWDKNSVTHYQSKLFPKEQVSQEPCTGRSIVYNTFVCSGIIASLVKKYAKKQETKFDINFDLGLMELV